MKESGRPTELSLANVEGSKETERKRGGRAKKGRERGKEKRRANERRDVEDVGEGGVEASEWAEKRVAADSPTADGNRKEPKNASSSWSSAPSEKQRDGVHPSALRHTHPHSVLLYLLTYIHVHIVLTLQSRVLPTHTHITSDTSPSQTHIA